MATNQELADKDLENEAWNLMDTIYRKVRETAPWVVNTTAWYDFGVPIILAALKAKIANTDQP